MSTPAIQPQALNNTPEGVPKVDFSFDDIFDTPQQPQAAPQAPPAPPVPQAPPAPAEPYLRTSTGTVYNSHEDAIRGTEEKDRRIEELRQAYITRTGYDPISGKPINIAPQATEVNYAADPGKFYSDLADANKSGDSQKFAHVMAKWQRDSLAPYMPTIAQAGKAIAVQALKTSIPNIDQFLESQEYQNYLSSRPLLKNTILAAEADATMAPSLKEVYAIAYDAANGRNLSQVLQNRQNITPGVTPMAPRPTLAPSTPSLPTSAGIQPDMSTPEGRKAIIEAGRAKGLDRVSLFTS